MQQYNAARTYQFRVQLTRDGHRRLDDRLAAHCRLYNAALQERHDAWRAGPLPSPVSAADSRWSVRTTPSGQANAASSLSPS